MKTELKEYDIQLAYIKERLEEIKDPVVRRSYENIYSAIYKNRALLASKIGLKETK